MRTWRKPTWTIVAWTAAFAAWGISGPAAVVELVGPGLAIGFVAVVWFVGVGLLAIAWFVSRPRIETSSRATRSA